MIGLQKLLDMSATEAIQGGEEAESPRFGETPNPPQITCFEDRTRSSHLPLTQYNLELLKRPDGSLYWEE